MTKEEAEIYLYSIAGDLGFRDAENYTCKDGAKMREAIEVLTQEPFMNKPCVAHQVCHEDKVKVLDKIRDEVCLIDDNIVLNPDSLYERRVYVRLIDVTDIIDKYTAKMQKGLTKEAIARWVCCPMCDKKKCEREADDCDVKIYLKSKENKE